VLGQLSLLGVWLCGKTGGEFEIQCYHSNMFSLHVIVLVFLQHFCEGRNADGVGLGGRPGWLAR